MARLIGGLLLSFRVAGVFAWGPFWGSGLFPMRVRLLTALVITVTLALALPADQLAVLPSSTGTAVILLALKELAVGSAMGLVAAFIMAAVKTAGQIASMQIGLTVANVMDPASSVQVSLMGNVLGLLALAVLLVANGHHQVLMGLAASVQVVPVGRLFPLHGVSMSVVQGAGILFVAALQMATPVILAVMLVNAGLGILARSVPQMNIFVVGLLVTVVVGVGIIGASLPGLVAYLMRWFDGLAETMVGVFQ